MAGLFPFDNNLGQRNVAPVPGGGGLRGLLTAFLARRFVVRNPFESHARVTLRAELPAFLVERGWKITLDEREGERVFGLGPELSRDVNVSLRPGRDFSPAEVREIAGGVNIRVLAFADEMLIGGMTYQLDPMLRRAPLEQRVGERPIGPLDPRIDET